MPWRRFIAHKIDDKKYLIVDTETGLEATVDGGTFGLMGEIQAHLGAELMNWLEKTPILPIDPWDDPNS